MLTGDSQAVANALAQDLTIDTVFAEALPNDVEKIKELKGQGKRVAMVGHGITRNPIAAPCEPADSGEERNYFQVATALDL